MTLWCCFTSLWPLSARPLQPWRSRPRSLRRLLALGTDYAPGVLINCTVGAAPFSPPDPSQFTIVVVHGINPCHPFMHLEMAQRYGEAIGATWGRSLNVLGWDWNGNSMDGPFPSRNAVLAQCQGRAMAEALMRVRACAGKLAPGGAEFGLYRGGFGSTGHRRSVGTPRGAADLSGPSIRTSPHWSSRRCRLGRLAGLLNTSGPPARVASAVPPLTPTCTIRP